MKRSIPLLFLVSFSAHADLFSEDENASSITGGQVYNKSDSSLAIFQEQFPKEGESALDALDQVAVKQIENSQRKKQQEKKKLAKKWKVPEQCHCYFNLCLTSENMSDTGEEWIAKKEASERYREKRNRICRRWSGDSKKYGPATLERELNELANDHESELNNALSAIKIRKQQENTERQAYLARLKTEEKVRKAEKQKARRQWQKEAEQACALVYQSIGSYCSVACALPEKTTGCKVIAE